ncbi:hypothetical protein SeMB42_g07242 [Synchytrium endobioticum]|uniref:Uncharacterized protein n=1 Tax=Synchytrium endobioticum TaxID=286115 RepID=A0A507CBN1_9FUNG|nr:hypothetical protein SeMB42_g07242 [Synchytrium endobioticum]
MMATAVMCLLWLVFLSASAVGNSKRRNRAAEEAAFKNLGAYANGNELLANKDHFLALQKHVQHMTAKLLAIYDKLAPKLEQGGHLVYEKDLKDLQDMREFATKEKLPWLSLPLPPRELLPCTKWINTRWAEYIIYLELLYTCKGLIARLDAEPIASTRQRLPIIPDGHSRMPSDLVLAFQKHMDDVTLKLKAAYNNLKLKYYLPAYLGNDPDMETIQKIISNEAEMWSEYPEKLPRNYGNFDENIFSKYYRICRCCSRLLNWHDRDYPSHLHQRPIDSARQSTPNHGNVGSAVSSRVTEPIASNQQWLPVTTDGNAGMSQNCPSADRSEFGSIPNFSLDDLHDNTLVHSSPVAEPTDWTQQWLPVTTDGDAEMLYGCCYADGSPFGTIPNFSLDDLHYNTLVHSSSVAEPTHSTPQWVPLATDGSAGVAQNYPYGEFGPMPDSSLGEPVGTTTAIPYMGDCSSIHETSRLAHPLTPYDDAGPSSSYAGIGTPYPFTTRDPPGTSGHDSSNLPSGSRRLERRSASIS